MINGQGREASWTQAMGQLSIGHRKLGGVQTRLLERAGDGTPIVFLHGLTGQAEIWLPAMRHVREGRRLVALDLVGRGGSELPDWVSPDNIYDVMVDQVIGLLDQASIERAVLVGSSLGALVAGLTALDHADRVAYLVLTNSGLIANERRPAGASNAASERLSMLQPPVTMATLVAHLQDTVVDTDRIDPLYMYARLGTYNSVQGQSNAANVSRFTRASPPIGKRSVRDRSAELEPETLLVWGDQDPRTDVASAEALRERIPRARIELFAGSGHFPFLEFPERFAEILDGLCDA